MSKNISISKDLLAAINNLCSGSEIKVMLSMLAYDSNTMSTIQMQNVTGITQSSNYFRIRRQLLNLGYLIIDENGMRVNTDKILSDYEKEKAKC